jgi:hypothetical protein
MPAGPVSKMGVLYVDRMHNSRQHVQNISHWMLHRTIGNWLPSPTLGTSPSPLYTALLVPNPTPCLSEIHTCPSAYLGLPFYLILAAGAKGKVQHFNPYLGNQFFVRQSHLTLRRHITPYGLINIQFLLSLWLDLVLVNCKIFMQP